MTTSNAFSYSFAIAGLLTFSTISLALKYEIAPKSIHPGQRATVKLRLSASLFHEDDDLPLINDKWLVENAKFQVLEQRLEKEGDDWVWRYDITAYKGGKITIPPVEIKVEGETYSSEAEDISITPLREEKDFEPRPEYGVLTPPIAWTRTLLLLSVLVGVCLVTLTGFFIRKHARRYLARRKKGPIPEPEYQIQEDPREWLKLALERLKAAIKENQTSPALSHVDHFSHILRDFYMRRHGLPVRSYTFQEIETKLSCDDTVSSLKNIFLDCDTFKFDPQSQIVENPFTLSAIEKSEQVILC